MKRYAIAFFSIFTAVALTTTGCNKEKNNDALAFLMLALAGSQTSVYSGSDPYGHFIELTINRSNSTVFYTDHTEPANNLGPLDYENLPQNDPLAGGFTLFYKADLDGVPGGNYALCVEIPGVMLVLAVFDETDNMIEVPTFAFARKNVSQSNYYRKAFNWMHVVGDDGTSGDPDVMSGFVASDSPGEPTPNGRLYGAEYSIQYDTTMNINDPPNLAVGALEKDPDSLALVGWMGLEGDWDNAIALLGNPATAVDVMFGENQGGGLAFAIPQALSEDFQADYAGTYAALVFQYDKGTDAEDAYPVTVVITSVGEVQVFPFGSGIDDPGSDAIYNQLMIPVEDYGAGALVNSLNTVSLLNHVADGASYAGILNAYLCHGAFISSGDDKDGDPLVVVVIFDPLGRFAGFHIYEDNGDDGSTANDILSIGLAVKDENFVSP